MRVYLHIAGAADRYHGGGVPGRRRASAARIRQEELTPEYWRTSAQDSLAALERSGVNGGADGPARNVIMFVGDGMSVTTLAAARTLKGQRAGRQGEDDQLSFETFPSVGLSKVSALPAQRIAGVLLTI